MTTESARTDTNGDSAAGSDRSDERGSAFTLGGESLVARLGLTAWDATAVVAIGLLVLLFAPNLMFPAWTPRAAAVLGLAPVGLVLLAFDRSRAAMLAWAVIVWSVLSALASPAVRSSLIGFAGRDLSALTVVASFGFWAVARRTTERGRSAMAEVLIWTIGMGALIGLLQVLLDLQRGSLALANGRPSGFLSNPVYFGAICSVGLIAAAARRSSASSPLVLVPLLLSGIGASLSGSRVALIAAVASLVALVAVRRDRGSAVSAGVAAASLAVGVGIDRIAGAGRNAADRLAEGTGGGRVTAWRYGIEAWLERPLTGHGLGRFRPAVQDRFSVAFVRDHARDEVSQAWFDAHNVVIGMLVAVGVVGLLLMAAWAVVAARDARGPLAWALLPIVLHWCLQPVSLYTLPLAMLLVGAAVPTVVERMVPRRLIAIGVALGIFLGGYLLVGDLRLRWAVDDDDPEAAASAAAMFGADPIARDIVAQVYAFKRDPAFDDDIVEWRRKVADAEPDRPFWWTLLGQQYVDIGRFAEAEEALERSVDLQEHNTRTWTTYGRLAIARNDADGLQEALDRLCELGQEECGLDAALLLEQAADGEQPSSGP